MMSKPEPCAKCGEPVVLAEDVVELVNALGKPLCQGCFALWRQTNPTPPEPEVEQRASKYQFTEGMGEISGFGGGYEQTCRNMLAAGVEWFDEHPEANPRFKGFKGVYGIMMEDNDDAKALSAAILEGSGDDCTGAMHQAVVGACLYIRKNGWDKYCKEMSRPKDAAQA